jgi:hypothetical protein
MYKNIVVVTNVVCSSPSVPSAFTSEERYEQLIETIESIYKNIPHPYIILVEGSKVDKKKFEDLHIHKLIMVSVDDKGKSDGELKLLQTLFSSDVIDSIMSVHNIDTINKISGRYSFCPEFSFNVNFVYQLNKAVWTGLGVCNTRYYRFPSIYLPEFRMNLESISSITVDIEHTFYQHKVLPITEEFMILNVHGHVAPTGDYIRD